MIHIIKRVFNLHSANKGGRYRQCSPTYGRMCPEEGRRPCLKAGRGLLMFELEIISGQQIEL